MQKQTGLLRRWPGGNRGCWFDEMFIVLRTVLVHSYLKWWPRCLRRECFSWFSWPREIYLCLMSSVFWDSAMLLIAENNVLSISQANFILVFDSLCWDLALTVVCFGCFEALGAKALTSNSPEQDVIRTICPTFDKLLFRRLKIVSWKTLCNSC